MKSKTFYFVLAVAIMIALAVPIYLQTSYFAGCIVWGIIAQLGITFLFTDDNSRIALVCVYVIILFFTTVGVGMHNIIYSDSGFLAPFGISILGFAGGHLVGHLIFKAKPEDN